MSKVIQVTNTFPADVQTIWRKLLDIDTLRFITSPMMTFGPVENEAESIWREGGVYAFKLRVLGLIPFGERHVINVECINPDRLIIQTQERNAVVSTWNHRIELIPQDGKTGYADIVEIDAGALTSLVALWSRAFYRHRQRRWLQLLKEESQ